jgi:predicted nuclease of predicted toxin-antitoxin system
MAEDIFIELYLDEDVDVMLADLLRSHGFVAHSTREAGLLGSSDLEQLQYAASHEKTLLTHNRTHFEKLSESNTFSGQYHAGIIIADRHPPYELLRRLLRILNHVTADEMQN